MKYWRGSARNTSWTFVKSLRKDFPVSAYHRFDLRQELMTPLLLDRFDLVVLLPSRGIVMVCSGNQNSRANLQKRALEKRFPDWAQSLFVLFDRKIDVSIWDDISQIFAPLLAKRDFDFVSTARISEFIEASMGVEALPPCNPEEHDHWLDQRFETIAQRKSDVERIVFENLLARRNNGTPMRLRIHGAAGCGKTISAIRAFTELTLDGKRTLLLCYNHRLGKWFNKRLKGKDGFANTLFHFARTTLIGAELENKRADANHMIDLIDVLNDKRLVIDTEDKYDAIIVDEGQDFRQEWADTLFKYFLKETGDILWLEDQNQNIINHQQPVLLPDGVFECFIEQNFRTPRLIADYSSQVLRKVAHRFGLLDSTPIVHCNNDVLGWSVLVHYFSGHEHGTRLLSERINALLADGVPRSEILLLSNCDDKSGWVMDYDNVLGRRNYRLKSLPIVELTRYTGEYDIDGSKKYDNNGTGIYCDSVLKVKGLEEYVVMLVDVGTPRSGEEEAYIKRLYCSLTRSKARLEVFVESGTPLSECFAG